MPTRSGVRSRLKALYEGAPRDEYFEAMRSEITRYEVSGETRAPGVSVVWCDRRAGLEI